MVTSCPTRRPLERGRKPTAKQGSSTGFCKTRELLNISSGVVSSASSAKDKKENIKTQLTLFAGQEDLTMAAPVEAQGCQKMLSARTHLKAQGAPFHYEQDGQLQTEMPGAPWSETILYPMTAASHRKRDNQLDHSVSFDTLLNWEGLQPIGSAILHQHKEHRPFRTASQQDRSFQAYDTQMQFHHQEQPHASSTKTDDSSQQHPLTAPNIFADNN
nr:hypothetical protein Iba_chr05aCG10720 [Ipomoea batatas]